MDIKINGVEFPDVDFTDAELVEAYEAGLDEYSRMIKAAERNRNQYSRYIREICAAVKSWVESCFGEETGDDVFDGRPNSLATALVVAGDLVNAFEESVAEIGRISTELKERAENTRDKIDSYVSQPDAPNRAQRRQQARSAGKRKGGGKYHKQVGPYDPERVKRDEYPAGLSAD